VLCQLLLGMPAEAGKSAPIKEAWAEGCLPDVGSTRFDSEDKPLARLDRAARLVSAVVARILTAPVMSDVKLYEFLHVLLVFMRALRARPAWRERYGYAFHPELIAPVLNALLCRLEDRGGDDWAALFRPEFPARHAPLNSEDKPGPYGASTTALKQEVLRRLATENADVVENAAEPAEAVAEAVAPDGGPAAGCLVEKLQSMRYSLPLPEDHLLHGLPFAAHRPRAPLPAPPRSEKQIARDAWEEAECARLARETAKATSAASKQGTKEQTAASSSAPSPAVAPETVPAPKTVHAPEATKAATQTTHTQAAQSADGAHSGQTGEQPRRDHYLFPEGWFEDSKYDFEERQVRQDYVQDLATVEYRELRVVWAAFQLIDAPGEQGGFFSREVDVGGRCLLGVPGTQVPKPYFGAEMPEVITREGGLQVVYVRDDVAEMAARYDAHIEENARRDEVRKKESAERRGRGNAKQEAGAAQGGGRPDEGGPAQDRPGIVEPEADTDKPQPASLAPKGNDPISAADLSGMKTMRVLARNHDPGGSAGASGAEEDRQTQPQPAEGAKGEKDDSRDRGDDDEDEDGWAVLSDKDLGVPSARTGPKSVVSKLLWWN